MIAEMPLLCSVTFVLMWAAMFVEYRLRLAVPAGLPGGNFGPRILSSVIERLSSIPALIIAIPAMRRILRTRFPDLPESTTEDYHRYFLLWILMILFGYTLVAVIPLASAIGRIAGTGGSVETAFFQTITLLLRILLAYVTARSALLFPHIASGGKIEWRAAWRDTRGHFFAVAFIYGAASTLPTYVVANYIIQYISSTRMDIFLVFPAQASIKFILNLLGISALAWIYLKFANDVLRLPEKNSHGIYREAG
ncbi:MULTISPECIES: hypothetical protein [Paraburkholderia]|uniref:Transmembrane protein n=1 Tax=Paraburkholderia metrosideri TaxID=580937 RepID=A0ABW9E4A1_9BURK